MFIKDTIPPITEYLEKALSTKTVIGEAQQFGNVTLIPVVDVTFGFGGGGGEGGTKENQGTGGGVGAGARVSAKAIVVIKDNEVTVQPLTRGSALEKIVESLPGLMEKLPMKAKKEETKE
ncbi:MAG TPA: spore germination protein GerW family protein [Symbiobacteriaceae bacterium]|nr:spore germination protein GerW family protein [Symbiobacteriaceae bacterium]